MVRVIRETTGILVLILVMSIFLITSGIAKEDDRSASASFAKAAISAQKQTATPQLIVFDKSNQPTVSAFFQEYRNYYSLSDDNDIRTLKAIDDQIGMRHLRMEQFYKGVKVFAAQYILHTEIGMVKSANGHLVHGLDMDVTPRLREETALQAALTHINARSYMWEREANEAFLKREQNDPDATFYPHGELLITSGQEKMVAEKMKLVYRFDIYAEMPLSRFYVDVDANTGEIVNKISRIHTNDVTATNTSEYDGNVDIIVTDNGGSNFTLEEHTTRGVDIETYDMLQGTNYAAATLFSASSPNGFSDAAAVSAHFGAESTFDYFMNEHGRNSYDNNGGALLSYVHPNMAGLGSSECNAFWDGSRMTYGDGTPPSCLILVNLDVSGHELAHGVTQEAAGLIYQDESGALNESFSDIFGNLVEFDVKGHPSVGSGDWAIGEEIVPGGPGIRNMQNPNAFGDPDTYFGTFWAPLGGPDNGGVHTNSGVQNFWFYLLSEGGSGTNDNGDGYSVTGIGTTKAAAIAYRNLTVYLTPGSPYEDARRGSELAAEDLYGAGSELQAVKDAWDAVGVEEGAPLAQLDVSPDPLNFEVPTNGTDSGTLNIANTAAAGAEDLNWVIAPYNWSDNKPIMAPTFSWEDISGVGTAVVLDDDDFLEVALPFTFPFFGNNKTAIKITSNGYLTFGTPNVFGNHGPIPNSSDVNDLIAIFWTDLDPNEGGTIHYHHDAVDGEFIVQYTNIQNFGGSLPFTFQAILSSTGSIKYQYLDMQGPLTDATVGIENSAGTAGVQVVNDAPYVENSLAVQFDGVPSWLTIGALSGTVSPGNTDNVSIAVDATRLSDGNYVFNIEIATDIFGNVSETVPVNLTVGTSSYSHNFSGGWEMVSLGLNSSETDYTILYPDAASNPMFGWGGSYSSETDLGMGNGYWLFFDNASSPSISGSIVADLNVTLSAGWNMVGGPSCDIAVGDIGNGGIINGIIFGFNGAYFEATTLNQGSGYWINTSSGGEITMSCATKNFAKEYDPNIIAGMDLRDLPALQIRDAAGFQQRLFYGVALGEKISRDNFRLPPVMPGMKFDARFSGDFRLIEGEEALIHLESETYPVHITLENFIPETGAEYILEERIGARVINRHVLREGETIEILNAQVNRLSLSKIDNIIPTEFALEQNYPNPFNPSTDIQFALPQAGNVTLEIYNALGQKIRTLVSEQKEAGRYTVTWDATNDFGAQVASGIYLYRVTAGAHTAMKKMILMK